ncbi:MAG: urease accessory protein UreD [Pseudomonadota bacterium]
MIPLRARPSGTPLAPGRQVAARLAFAAGPGGTWLAGQRTPHPFHITRPFRLAGDPAGMATLYLQSSSGGLYGDDDLDLAIRVGKGAAAHVTTQASTVVHHARGGETRTGVTIEAAEDSLVEYLPDPAILFAGARLDTRLTLSLAPGARAIVADAQLSHDPAGAGDPFERLCAETRIVAADGTPRLIDSVDIDGASWRARTAPWSASAMLVVAGHGDAPAAAGQIGQALAQIEGVWAGASAFGDRDLVVVRLLAEGGVALTRGLATAWAAGRIALTGSPPPARQK